MYQEAIKQYTETIGFLNPSYVIQKYLDVQKLDNLITYLESLNASSRKPTPKPQKPQIPRKSRHRRRRAQELHSTPPKLLRKARRV
jgi:hypothetical protein